jgi:phosphoribosylamine--glycine ligase
MSRCRLISKYGDGAALGLRLAAEGHDVDLWIKVPDAPNLYQGILPRVKDWKQGISKDTILVFDMSGFGKEVDEYKAKGFRVIGGSKIADEMELDRGFGLAIAENHGIAVPPSQEFNDFAAAKEFLAEKGDEGDGGWVFKPNDNKEDIPTFVATSTEQMVAMLEHYETLWKGDASFVLQQVVEGTEVSSEVWCVEGVIIPGSYNNTLEQKKLMPGDLGPNTGCMGSTVRFGLCPRIYDEVFKKLQPWLKAQKFTGPLDINCIVADDETPYMLEWTPRFGYSAIYAFAEGLNMPLGEFFEAIASGEIPTLDPLEEWLGALRLTMPPYPHCEDVSQDKGVPLLGLELDDEHTWPLDVMLNEGRLVCSGANAIIAEVTGHSDDLSDLWSDIYGRTKMLQIPEVQYRTDNYVDVQRRVDELEALDYIAEGVLNG